MAKKENIKQTARTSPANVSAAPVVAAKAVAATSPVRNTAIPKAVAAPKPAGKSVSWEQISYRAYEISQSSSCGSEMDNWLRAERELHGR